MIIFTVTNTRKKRNLLLKLALVLVMVAFLLPYLHGLMLEVSAMQNFEDPPVVGRDAEGLIEEDFPGEPVRVDGELWLPLNHWQEVATLLSY